MVRDSKRSWSTSVYAISGRGFTPIVIPSATEQALAILGQKECFRCVKEKPSKWIDADTLVIRASGDTTLNNKVIWYEVDVTYSINKKSIIHAKLISIEPHEG